MTYYVRIHRKGANLRTHECESFQRVIAIVRVAKHGYPDESVDVWNDDADYDLTSEKWTDGLTQEERDALKEEL